MAGTFPRIICTLGACTDEVEILRDMTSAGMGMARINTAYASLEEIQEHIRLLRVASEVPIMLDLKGPQLRVDATADKIDPDTGENRIVPCRYEIHEGDLIFVGFATGPVQFNYEFARDLDVGDVVTFDNGNIRTVVADPEAEEIDAIEDAVLLEVLDAGNGEITPQMDANVPGRVLRVPRLSERDRRAIRLGIGAGVEWYALSFVRNPQDLRNLHTALSDAPDAGIIAKIEERSGIEKLEAIAATAETYDRPFAVMICRGDLFVELPFVELAQVQEDLTRRCNKMGVPCIVATGLLPTMRTGPRPSRAEIGDVAAAVRAGVDSLLLSDETSNGVHPTLVVHTLNTLIARYSK